MSATRAPTLAQGAPRALDRATGAASGAGAPVAKLGGPFGPPLLATDSGHRPGAARIKASGIRMATRLLQGPFTAILVNAARNAGLEAERFGLGVGRVAHHRRLRSTSSESPSSRSATLVSSTFDTVVPPGGSTSTETVSFKPPLVAKRERTFV